MRRTGLKKELLISRFLVKIAMSFFKSKDSYHSKYFEKCVDLKWMNFFNAAYMNEFFVLLVLTYIEEVYSKLPNIFVCV